MAEPGMVEKISMFPVRECVVVICTAFAAYIFLAIYSYAPIDTATATSSEGLDVTNVVGSSGLWVARLALLTFGYIAYLLPMALLIGGLNVVLRRGTPWSWTRAVAKAGTLLVILIALCVLVQLHMKANDPDLVYGTGGIIGSVLVQYGNSFLKPTGLTIVSVALLIVGQQTLTNISWLTVAEWIGSVLYRVFGKIIRFTKRYWVWIHLQENEDSKIAALTVSPTVPPKLGLGTKVEHRSSKESLRIYIEPTVSRSAPNNKETVARKVTPAVSSLTTLSTAYKKDTHDTIPVLIEKGMPSLKLLDVAESNVRSSYSNETLEILGEVLVEKLADFGVKAEVESILPGPVVTRFEILPAPGVKVSKITALVKDIARSLSVVSVRVVETIPGKSVIGIEIPNDRRSIVRLSDILSSPVYKQSDSPLTIAIGKNVAGEVVVADISGMPHLLVAGTTGSGKSVAINAMLLSMLYKATPDDVRFILIDPKMLELSVYDGIPHLLTPVVTDMREASQALNWCVGEMERRYNILASLGVRSLEGYNRRIESEEAQGNSLLDPTWPDSAPAPPPALKKLPLIVVVIDEFADMMMIVGKKLDQVIARIAQKARAAGIHLVLATQRPSVDVITGLIKANIPCRISFLVPTRIDSRTIIDQGGAEQLLGQGDMLYVKSGSSVPERVHGAFVSDEEVHAVVAAWKKIGDPVYELDLSAPNEDTGSLDFINSIVKAEGEDELYAQAVRVVLEHKKASISFLQRKLSIGYNRAAKMIEAMEIAGLVSEQNSSGNREILVCDDA